MQANMEAIAGIFPWVVPIIQSQVSKWYSTTKSPTYAQQNCKNVRQTCKEPYNFPLRITVSQYFLALPYASCRVQEGCQTLKPLVYNPGPSCRYAAPRPTPSSLLGVPPLGETPVSYFPP